MWDRFTSGMEKAAGPYAYFAAKDCGSNCIGTEHLLLGLITEEVTNKDGACVLTKTLEHFGSSLEKLRDAIDAVIGTSEVASSGEIPFTPRAKKVLEYALRESLHFEGQRIGPEHLLLGLIREGEGVAARVLGEIAAGEVMKAYAVELIVAQAEALAASKPSAEDKEVAGDYAS